MLACRPPDFQTLSCVGNRSLNNAAALIGSQSWGFSGFSSVKVSTIIFSTPWAYKDHGTQSGTGDNLLFNGPIINTALIRSTENRRLDASSSRGISHAMPSLFQRNPLNPSPTHYQGIRHYSNSVSSLHYSYFLKCNEYSLHFSLLQQCSFDKLQFSLHYITYGGGWECTNRSISITPNLTVVVLISKCISTMNVYVTHSCNHQTCIAIRIRI